jgi:hypothetical protein
VHVVEEPVVHQVVSVNRRTVQGAPYVVGTTVSPGVPVVNYGAATYGQSAIGVYPGTTQTAVSVTRYGAYPGSIAYGTSGIQGQATYSSGFVQGQSTYPGLIQGQTTYPGYHTLGAQSFGPYPTTYGGTPSGSPFPQASAAPAPAVQSQ